MMQVLLLTAVALESITCASHSLAATQKRFDGVRQLLESGKYAEASTAARNALGVVERESGPNSLEAARVLDVLAEALWRGGKAHEPETFELAERAVTVKELRLGANHPELARSLDNLGVVLFLRGQYTGAREALERARAIQDASLPAGDSDRVRVLSHLAPVLQTIGDYSAARPLYEQALAIQEKALGPDHPDVAKTLNNLATLLKDMGDYASARPLYERALTILTRTRGPEHPLVAMGASNLGELLHRLGDYPRARELYESSIAAKERVLGPEHPSLAITLNNLGELYFEQGRNQEARALYRRAMAIQEKTLGPDHPDLTNALSNLAKVSARQGQIETARSLYERALTIREQSLGADHPLVADVLFKLAFVYAAAGETKDALATALRAEEVSREHLRLTARVLPERQALGYARARISGLDLVLSLAVDGEARLERVWDAVIRSRALTLDEMAARRRSVRSAGDARLARLAEGYREASERLANLAVRGPGGWAPEVYRERLREARREKERSERRLGEASVRLRRELARKQIGWFDLREALPSESALVAYLRYGHRRQSSTASRPSYLALVLASDRTEPRIVPLGSARPIEDAVRRWRSEVLHGLDFPGRRPADAERAAREAGQALRKKIWDPLATHVTEAERIFIVPDGALNLVHVGALPAEEGGYLVEHGPLLHHLSTERDLVQTSQGEPALARGDLLAMGGPDFDATASHQALREGESRSILGPLGAMLSSFSPFRGGISTCQDSRARQFPPLPGTWQETEEITRLWQDSRDPAEVLRLTDESASELAFKRYASAYRTVHIATHGFFLAGDCTSWLDGADVEEPRALTGENPLLLSGLVLAGANQRGAAGPDDEDGILTAEEIAALDLSGVEWVVLSGCDTGRGEVRAGEGVFGLRRAFQVAGARTLIMSLWPVDDDATRAWMAELYLARLAKRLGAAEAVRAAHRAVLAQRRDRGASTHPFYWAAFVAAGNWR